MENNIDILEQEAIEKVKNGYIDAFEYLVKKYEKKIFILVHNVLHQKKNKEDIVQEIFFKAYKNIQYYNQETAQFSTWLLTIARNACLNENRKNNNSITSEDIILESTNNPEDEYLKKELYEKLDVALKSIPFKYRIVFVLAELDGFSYAEIAQMEDIKIGTVKSRLFRAKEKIQSILKEYRGKL